MFSILPGSDGKTFVIDQAAKELRLGDQGLNREEKPRVILVVELQSSGFNRGFATASYFCFVALNSDRDFDFSSYHKCLIVLNK